MLKGWTERLRIRNEKEANFRRQELAIKENGSTGGPGAPQGPSFVAAPEPLASQRLESGCRAHDFAMRFD
jgi:hypothetical protein